MLKYPLAAGLIATTFAATLASAQTSPSPSPPANPPPATTSPATPGMSSSVGGQFVAEQSMSQWRASKLVGVDVYGTDNQKIGDINEVLLNKEGMAEAVVIGVGGFLGIGEKNVAVPFKALEWTTEPRATTGTAVTDPAGRATTGGTTAPNTTAATAPTRTDPASAEASQGYPDRAVLRMSRADLQNAPTFRYAGDTRAAATSPAAPPNQPTTPSQPSTAPRQ